MSILQNALDSIAIGLEDFKSIDERRIISSTRNIFAGILLLFKHRLCELSPEGSDEALIKQKVLPEFDSTGAVNWIGRGNKTVDVQNIKDRFNSLNISVDWKRLEKINKYRNDIEHYYSTLKNDSIQQLISDSFIIIRDFIADELSDDPKSLLGEEYWKILVDVNEVYAKEKQDCDSSLGQLNYFSSEILHALQAYSCKECGSNLIETELSGDATDASFICKGCEKVSHYEEIANIAVNNFYEEEGYLAYTDGGDIPLVDCPFCFEGVYIFHEGICVTCGSSATHDCIRCGCGIPPEEISDDDTCGYCSHMIAKVMSE
jgi:hypothetical protein